GRPPAVDVLSCLISRPFLGASRPCTQRSGLAPLRGYSALKIPTARRESSAASAAATPHDPPISCLSRVSWCTPTLFAAPAPRLFRSERSTARRESSAASAAATPHEPPNFVPFACFVVHPDTLRASRSALAPPAPLCGYSALKRPTALRESSAASAAATPHEPPDFVPFVCFVVHHPFSAFSACSVVTPTLSVPLAPHLRLLRLFAATPL
ncbi:MAG: hypothetical protein RLZZ188_3093, partial [Verrucomicrobiota bacterium]